MTTSREGRSGQQLSKSTQLPSHMSMQVGDFMSSFTFQARRLLSVVHLEPSTLQFIRAGYMGLLEKAPACLDAKSGRQLGNSIHSTVKTHIQVGMSCRFYTSHPLHLSGRQLSNSPQSSSCMCRQVRMPCQSTHFRHVGFCQWCTLACSHRHSCRHGAWEGW